MVHTALPKPLGIPSLWSRILRCGASNSFGGCPIAGYRLGWGRVCGFIRALDDTVSWLTASKIGLCCCVVATLRLVVVAVSVAIVVLVVGCGQ